MATAKDEAAESASAGEASEESSLEEILADGGKGPQELVTVEFPAELLERARESRDRMNELLHRGEDYWGEAGELELIHLEILALVYGD